MATDFSNTDLEAFLDEGLPADRMAAIEDALRKEEQLQQRVTALIGRRDAGVHSLGEIWRRHRLSCPAREQLGSYLLGVLPRKLADYVDFHLTTIECRFCQASIADLKAQQTAAEAAVAERRRQKYFHSSAGYLRR
jgi:hypothetical protein